MDTKPKSSTIGSVGSSLTFVLDQDGTERLAVTLLERAIDFALNVALGHILALVVELFAATQAQQQLYTTIGIKVELQRHQA